MYVFLVPVFQHGLVLYIWHLVISSVLLVRISVIATVTDSLPRWAIWQECPVFS